MDVQTVRRCVSNGSLRGTSTACTRRCPRRHRGRASGEELRGLQRLGRDNERIGDGRVMRRRHQSKDSRSRCESDSASSNDLGHMRGRGGVDDRLPEHLAGGVANSLTSVNRSVSKEPTRRLAPSKQRRRSPRRMGKDQDARSDGSLANRLRRGSFVWSKVDAESVTRRKRGEDRDHEASKSPASATTSKPGGHQQCPIPARSIPHSRHHNAGAGATGAFPDDVEASSGSGNP